MLFIIKPDARRSMETGLVLCSPDLKYFLVSGLYIGRTYLPKSRQEVIHYG